MIMYDSAWRGWPPTWLAPTHSNTMSWQGYVDTNLVGTGKVTTAAIIGLKGGVWAASPGFNVSPEEQQAIIKGLDDPTPLQASGVYVNGKKYLTLQANPRSIYGKAAVSASYSHAGRRRLHRAHKPGCAHWRLHIPPPPRRRKQGGRGPGRLLDLGRLLAIECT